MNTCWQHRDSRKEVGLHLKTNDGLIFLSKWEIAVYADESGMPEYLQVIGHEVELLKNGSANELLESELFFKNLIAESLDGIVLADINGVIDFASPSIKKILGYNSEEVLGKTLFDFTFSDDAELAIRTFREEIESRQDVKFINIRLIKKSGELLWCIVRGHNMLENPHISKMVIYFSDDTLRKNAEDALVESKNKLKEQATIVNNVTDIIVTTDLNRIITSWNSVIEKLTGITAQDAIGRRFRDVIDTNYAPYDHDQVAAIVMKDGIWRGEISFVRNNGEKIYLLHTVSMLYDESGETIGMLGVGKDITERKKAETRLQQSELFYRSLSYYSIDGVLMSDHNGYYNLLWSIC